MAHTLPVGSFQTAVQGPRWSREGKPTGSEERQEISVLGEKVLEFAGQSTGEEGACRERGLEPHKGIHLTLCLNTSLHRLRVNPYKARQERRLRKKTVNRELSDTSHRSHRVGNHWSSHWPLWRNLFERLESSLETPKGHTVKRN